MRGNHGGNLSYVADYQWHCDSLHFEKGRYY
eukprot:COSAG05_NODE_10003_length_588_cov_1.216769_1_plen_30_part_10